MPSRVVLKCKDFDSEASNFGFLVPTLTSGNLDAQVTAIGALTTAINAVSLATFDGRSIFVEDTPASSIPVSEYAQRETKWRVTFTDDVNPIGNGSFEIPCADLSLLLGGTGDMNTAAGAGADLVAAIEATLRSRLGNTITVTSVKHVGRNL